MRIPIIACAMAFLIGCTESRNGAGGVTNVDAIAFSDFSTLQRPGSPNNHLIVAANASDRQPYDAVAPIIPIAAHKLVAAWIDVVQKQPRTRILGISDDGLQVEAEQRSALIGFVDRVSFRAVPLGIETSTFFAYSQSQVGYWDLGVNRGRLTDWIAAVEKEVGETDQSG